MIEFNSYFKDGAYHCEVHTNGVLLHKISEPIGLINKTRSEAKKRAHEKMILDLAESVGKFKSFFERMLP